jgi:AcrR family transcriptional regulator
MIEETLQDSARSTKRLTNARGRARRAAIIEAARELCGEGGWRGSGLTAVAERVGITHPGVLHHFGTKLDLLLAVVEDRDQRAEALYDGMSEDSGFFDLIDRIVEVARQAVHDPTDAKVFVVLHAESLSEGGGAQQFFVTRQNRIIEAFESMVQLGQDRGEVRAEIVPRHVARRIVAFMDGATQQYLTDSENVDLVEMYRDFVAGLKRELAPLA